QGCWRAARAAGIPTGGGVPLGYLTEGADGRGDKPHPELAEMYGAREMPTARYPQRIPHSTRRAGAGQGERADGARTHRPGRWRHLTYPAGRILTIVEQAPREDDGRGPGRQRGVARGLFVFAFAPQATTLPTSRRRPPPG